jgi:small Trp-rich protein
MFFVLVGVILLVLKLSDWAPVANWHWGIILSPNGLALAWWAWADASGFTRRRVMEKERKRIALRRERNLEALGMGVNQRNKDRNKR